MPGILKLNPLILEKIESLEIPKNMKEFLEKVLYLELEKSERGEDRYTSDYEKLVQAFADSK